MKHKDKVAIVTGASMGIGKAMAFILADEGCHVVCAARSRDKIEANAVAIRAKGRRGLAVATDVSDKNSVQQMVAATMITVPATGGQDPAAAEELINASDLNAKIQTRTIVSNQPEGTVARTVPGAGKSVPRGSQILIYISKGGTLKVPDVAGMSVVDAKSTLLAAGFAAVSEPQASQTQFFVQSDTIPAGFVVGTTPAAGTSATATGAILLILSTGP